MLILCSLFITSCSEEEAPLSESFFKIYDDSNFDLSYDPIDVVETVDGFVILTGTEISNSDFDGIQLIKLDQEGNFVEESEIDEYVAAAGEIYLNPSDSNIYFFALEPVTPEAVLLSVDTDLNVTQTTLLSGLGYPLSSSPLNDGTLLLQSYDNLNTVTEISNIGLDGSFLGGNSYSIGPGSEVDILEHFLEASDRPLPFFCGEYSTGNYFFNGFYNYSFSTVFTNFSDDPNGVLQGQNANAGLRAALTLSNGDFAIAGYQYDENFQIPSITLNTGGIGSSEALYEQVGNMAEIKPYTSAKIVNYSGSAGEYTVFASETKGNQIVLHFYNSTSGTIDGIQFVGFLNPFTFSSIKVTSDEALLILGTTFVAGRFERIVLNKISKVEIRDLLK